MRPFPAPAIHGYSRFAHLYASPGATQNRFPSLGEQRFAAHTVKESWVRIGREHFRVRRIARTVRVTAGSKGLAVETAREWLGVFPDEMAMAAVEDGLESRGLA